MKRFTFIALLFVLSLAASAQGIYTKKTKYDKFDDVVWTKNVKTLITMYNDSIVFETKGQNPETYMYIDSEYLAAHIGDRDNLENLVGDVYGFENQYYGFTKSMAQEIYDEIALPIGELNPDDNEAAVSIIMAFLDKLDEAPTITFRTISSTRYTFSYKTDIVWIRYPDGARIIYEK